MKSFVIALFVGTGLLVPILRSSAATSLPVRSVVFASKPLSYSVDGPDERYWVSGRGPYSNVVSYVQGNAPFGPSIPSLEKNRRFVTNKGGCGNPLGITVWGASRSQTKALVAALRCFEDPFGESTDVYSRSRFFHVQRASTLSLVRAGRELTIS
jgi:hypothetical protein